MNRFQSVRFGELKYQDQDVISLPEGLVGLINLKRWLLLDSDQAVPLKWLHSLDRADFCVPVADPALFSDSFEVKLTTEAQRKVGARSISEVAILIITTIHPGGTRITGNLLAPLVIGSESRRGVQLALADESWSVQQEMDYFKFGLASSSDGAENGASDASLPSSAGEENSSRDTDKVSI